MTPPYLRRVPRLAPDNEQKNWLVSKGFERIKGCDCHLANCYAGIVTTDRQEIVRTYHLKLPYDHAILPWFTLGSRHSAGDHPAMPHLSVCLLGPLQIICDGAAVTGLESNKVRALLAYLAAQPDRPHPRDILMGLLWPDLPDAAARHNLRQALANLRQTLGDRTAQAPLLLIDREMIRLNPAGDYEIDMATFVVLLSACDSHVHRRLASCTACMRRLQAAAEKYRGDFLEGFFLGDSAAFEDWMLRTRERLHRLALDTLTHLAVYHERRGAYEAMYSHALRQIELEPWHEEAHRQAMRALYLSGQRGAALTQYERCRATLDAELGIEPEQETTALYARIRIKEREVGKEPAVLALPASPSDNLPVQPTAFVGRETELAELADLLANPACRLLTIIGPGGIGKTRLALQAAADQVATFTHGAWFVPLAALGSTEFLVSAIADALALTFQGPKDPQEQLLAYLREKELLLVLDNFEHLLDGTRLLAEIIQRTSTITLLVTSRTRLALRAEWLFDLTGLSCPPVGFAGLIETYSAPRLFLQSARQVRRQFAPAEEDTDAIARICRLVEGMPLAIELTAAAVRERSCVAIATAIETAMQLPEAPWQDAPERHRSMQAVFEHSWRLLSDQERHVLRKLSVFRGGFRLDAAVHVTSTTLPLLAALSDKSLLRCSKTGRYDMHELIRQYAIVKLAEAGARQQTQDDQLEYFLALAEATEPMLMSASQQAGLDQLEAEQDNLRAALEWALTRQDTILLARLSGALGRFWYLRGHLSEGRYWAELAIEMSDWRSQVKKIDLQDSISDLQSPVVAKALYGAGLLAWHQGDYPAARDRLEQSVTLWRWIGNQQELGYTLLALAEAGADRIDQNLTLSRLEESSALFQELGDDWGLAAALIQLSNARAPLGDSDPYLWLQTSMTIARELGDQRSLALGLFSLGRLEYLRGNYLPADGRLQEALAEWQALEDRWMLAVTLNLLGEVARCRDDYTRAEAYYEQSLALFREVGGRGASAKRLHNLAYVALHNGDVVRAEALFREIMAEFQDLADQWGIAACVEGLAGVAVAQGCVERGARLLAAADQLRATIGSFIWPADQIEHDRHLAAVRAQLGDAAFAAAWAAGRAMMLDEAVAEALNAARPPAA
jgi:DNA-binding SARP family transcriptional activator/predicted ATPase